jgi:hypothetical protein
LNKERIPENVLNLKTDKKTQAKVGIEDMEF